MIASVAALLVQSALSLHGVVIPPDIMEARTLDVVTTAPIAYVSEDGQSRYARSATRVHPLASMTKLMTALVILNTVTDWDDEVVYRQEDDHIGAGIPLVDGDRVTRDDLFRAMLVSSSNNATAALVRSTGMTPDQFVRSMNNTAQELGLESCVFVEPTGLNAGNMCDAVDVARLLDALMKYPSVSPIMQQSSVVISVRDTDRVIWEKTTNELLGGFLARPPYALVGAKTGFISESGYNMAVQVQTGARTLTGVIMGAPTIRDRFQDMKALLYWVSQYR